MSKGSRMSDLRSRFDGLREQYAQAMMDQGSLRAELLQVTTERDLYAGEIAQIRAALNEVTTYEGLVEVSPVAMMVAQLAQDHEELETRIEAVLSLIALIRSLRSPRRAYVADDLDEIVRLLRGGTRVPDTLEGLDG